MFRGICRGGPLADTEWQSNFPSGFLLVNRPVEEVVIYDWQDGEFIARALSDGTVKLQEDVSARFRAALEETYDVWTYDPERMPPW